MAVGDVNVTVVGNTTGPAEIRFTPSGAAVANFTVAVNARKKNPQTNEWEAGDTTFYRINAWRSLAENVAETINDKGMKVIVQGRLENRPYEVDGQKRTSLEVTADAIGPDLSFATAVVKKADRQGGGGQPQQARGGQQANAWGGSGGQSPANAWGAPQQPANNGWGGQQ